ncbi:MAG: hypothetical protein AAFQ41_15310 [Cyanobacteria bacterium J06623_7]
MAIEILLARERVQIIVDDLEDKFSHLKFELLILPVEAIATQDNLNSPPSTNSQLGRYIQP